MTSNASGTLPASAVNQALALKINRRAAKVDAMLNLLKQAYVMISRSRPTYRHDFRRIFP